MNDEHTPQFHKESIFGNFRHHQCKTYAVAKLAIFYMLNAAVLELQFACKILCSEIHLIVRRESDENFEKGLFKRQYWRFAFVFRIFLLEY